MEIKYMVEIDVAEDVVKKLAMSQLTIDDIVTTRIETALGTLTRGATLVYRAEQGRSPVDMFKQCPVCNHPWGKHFVFFEGVKKLDAPRPDVCDEPNCGCSAKKVIDEASKK